MTTKLLVRKSRPLKHASEKAVRFNTSLPPALYNRRHEVQTKFATSTFADYVAMRLRKDLGIELPS